MAIPNTVGIYGGTFSPPHAGHVHAGLTFLRQLKLDRVMIMPARIPPHKPDGTIDPFHRLKMTQLAFSDAPEYGEQLFVSDFEITRTGLSYTVHTLRFFRHQGFTDLYFLCGTDMFLTLERWKEPEELFRLATIVYIRRENESPVIRQRIEDAKYRYRLLYNAEPIELIADPIEISSSEIRQKLVAGENVDQWISPKVREYIHQNGLYLSDEGSNSHD